MLEGWHSTSGEPQSVNPLQHYGWWCWDCFIIAWWSTARLQSDSNQNFCLANPKFLPLLSAAGPWYSQCAAVAPSCMTMAGNAAGGCRGVAQPECRGHRQNSTSVHVALDIDQWEFAINGNVTQHHDGSVSAGMSSLNTGRMETFTGTFFDALRVCPIPGEDPSYCCGII